VTVSHGWRPLGEFRQFAVIVLVTCSPAAAALQWRVRPGRQPRRNIALQHHDHWHVLRI
jgi:hypothetical protein